jgi:predicted small integral membrane protein
MPWIQRHAVAVAAIAAALSATAGIFVVARPAYHPRVTDVLVDMTKEDHYTVAEIRAAFARESLRLYVLSTENGIVNLSTQRHGPSAFLVSIFAPTSKVDFTAPGVGVHALVERRVGNVMISYGGHDRALAARIEAAADALKH